MLVGWAPINRRSRSCKQGLAASAASVRCSVPTCTPSQALLSRSSIEARRTIRAISKSQTAPYSASRKPRRSCRWQAGAFCAGRRDHRLHQLSWVRRSLRTEAFRRMARAVPEVGAIQPTAGRSQESRNRSTCTSAYQNSACIESELYDAEGQILGGARNLDERASKRASGLRVDRGEWLQRFHHGAIRYPSPARPTEPADCMFSLTCKAASGEDSSADEGLVFAKTAVDPGPSCASLFPNLAIEYACAR